MKRKNGHKPIRKISDLIPDAKNLNLGTERGQQMIENSLRKYGMGRSMQGTRV